MFALANRLAHEGRLSPDEWSWWRANNDWYEAVLPDPYKVMPSLADRTKHPHTFAWFKTTATPFLHRLPGYLRLLDVHSVEWVELRSAEPGMVVYEDEAQIIVAPLMRESASGKLRITGTPEATWLRPTTPNDREFVASVTEQAMRGYVEQLFGR